MTRLRPATAQDTDRIGAILSDWIDDTPWMPRLHTRAEDTGFARMMIERGWVTVAQARNVTGFLARNGAEIQALYVDRSARGQGIGSQLLTDAMRQADHLTLWTFQVNTGAQAFYQRHGFHPLRRSDGARNDEALPDIYYGWQRSDP